MVGLDSRRLRHRSETHVCVEGGVEIVARQVPGEVFKEGIMAIFSQEAGFLREGVLDAHVDKTRAKLAFR
jgi:hypothetical protein